MSRLFLMPRPRARGESSYERSELETVRMQVYAQGLRTLRRLHPAERCIFAFPKQKYE